VQLSPALAPASSVRGPNSAERGRLYLVPLRLAKIPVTDARYANRYAMPAIFQYREFAAAGGLMSYGGSVPDSYRLSGVYTGRILKGEKPADLPIQQATKVELIVNLKTAKTLGLTVPMSLLTRADELIE